MPKLYKKMTNERNKDDCKKDKKDTFETAQWKKSNTDDKEDGTFETAQRRTVKQR